MGVTTGIDWTDSTWNPIRGCTRVSEGCRNCYAEGVARRFSGPGLPYEGLVRIGSDGKPHEWNGNIHFAENHLLDPLKWKTPRRIFVNSMSDLFHENVATGWQDSVLAVAAMAPWHQYQILTKRPETMYRVMSSEGRRQAVNDKMEFILKTMAIPRGSFSRYTEKWPLPNVWLGVSVENQKAADERIPLLLQTPAALRFLSMEPLLGSVDLSENRGGIEFTWLVQRPQGWGIDWVIAGGESGPGARPMHPDWARLLRDQCARAGVPFFFKQWGEWAKAKGFGENGAGDESRSPFLAMTKDGYTTGNVTAGMQWADDGGPYTAMRRVGKKAAGHLLDGVEHHAFPEVA